jgi:aspartate/methionine/tyrosine aminotransferase
MLLLLPRHTRSFVQLLCLRVQEGLMLMADEVYQENIYCDKPFVCKLLAR